MENEEINFAELGVTRQFIQAMDDMGFVAPTPIQEKALPPSLSGQDIIGIAQTGTGKTAAFVLPILMRLKYAQGDLPRGIVLSPTKELVVQTAAHMRKLASYTDLRVVELYGGAKLKRQRETLAEGVDVIIATPGRLLEFYSQGILPLNKIQILVLDEADRMMDMGFMPQLRQLLEVVPTKRQNLLYSATFGERVEGLSHEFLEFPTRIEIAPSATVAETIEHFLVKLPNFRSKLAYLESIVDEQEIQKMIIFCRTKDRADRVHRYLDRKLEGGVNVIHSNKGQNTRINTFNAFREGELRILVATDVSSRGIDVAEVSHVVNFDIPRSPDDYTHRIGRTGRATRSGIAISLIDPSELYYVKRIEEQLQYSIERKAIHFEMEKKEFLPGEEQELARAIDYQKQKEDPNYQGAFHRRGGKKKRG